MERRNGDLQSIITRQNHIPKHGESHADVAKANNNRLQSPFQGGFWEGKKEGELKAETVGREDYTVGTQSIADSEYTHDLVSLGEHRRRETGETDTVRQDLSSARLGEGRQRGP